MESHPLTSYLDRFKLVAGAEFKSPESIINIGRAERSPFAARVLNIFGMKSQEFGPQ